MMLHCIKSIRLDIWRVERCVCFWPSCLSEPTSFSAVVTLSSVRSCISLPISCLCLCFLFFQFFVINILSLIFKNSTGIFLKTLFFKTIYTLLALPLWLNGVLQYQYIITALKIIICNNIVCFLFTNIRKVSETKQNLIYA